MADTKVDVSPEDEADENPTTGTEGDEPTGNESEGDEGTDASEGDDNDDSDDDGSQLSDEALRTELKRVRQEASSRRIENRELKEQLAKAKTPEEFQAVQDRVAQLERERLVSDVADGFKLPKELREVLKGETEEELKAHAKVLAQFAPAEKETPPPFLGGGLDPNDDDDDEMNPGALAKKVQKRRF